jgi:hypothetical protein
VTYGCTITIIYRIIYKLFSINVFMITKAFKLFILIILLASVSSSFSAELHDEQSWWSALAMGPIYKGSERTKFKFWLEGIQRLGDYNSRSTQRLLRPGLGFMLNENTSVWLGFAWIETGVPLSQETVGEKRIWQQLLWVKKYFYLTLTSRLRFEQRFISNNPVVSWRIRELLKMVVPFSSNQKWSLVGSSETFAHNSYNYSKETYVTGFDQNRFFMGIGHKFNKAVSLEVGYLNQFINRHNNPHFLSNNIATNLIVNF